MTEQSPAPLTRRELRLAGLTVAAPTAPPAGPERTRRVDTEPASRHVPGPYTAQAPVTRRDLRAAERACRRPFALALPTAADRPTAPRGAAHRRAASRQSGTGAAKASVVVALSGALFVTGIGYTEAESSAIPGVAAFAQAESEAEQAERAEEARRARAEGAATARLSGQAAAHAAIQRDEALELATTAVETATTVSGDVSTVLKQEELDRLDEAVAELTELTEVVLRRPKQLPAGAITPEEVADAGEPAAVRRGPEGPRTSRDGAGRTEIPTDGTTGESTGEATAAPSPGTPSDDDTASAAEAPLAAAAGSRLLPGTASSTVLEMEASAALRDAAVQVERLTTEVQESADRAEAKAKARAEAKAERARKIAVAQESPNGAIPSSVLCSPDFAPDALLRCDAAEALEKLNAAYRADFGRDLEVVSSYRSYAAQVSTRRTRGGLAATPGSSNHGRSVAVDFGNFGSVGQFTSPNYAWMKANAGEFGWHHPRIMEPGGGGPQEPWHWEFGTTD